VAADHEPEAVSSPGLVILTRSLRYLFCLCNLYSGRIESPVFGKQSHPQDDVLDVLLPGLRVFLEIGTQSTLTDCSRCSSSCGP
jgi:hypothetical protein